MYDPFQEVFQKEILKEAKHRIKYAGLGNGVSVHIAQTCRQPSPLFGMSD